MAGSCGRQLPAEGFINKNDPVIVGSVVLLFSALIVANWQLLTGAVLLTEICVSGQAVRRVNVLLIYNSYIIKSLDGGVGFYKEDG